MKHLALHIKKLEKGKRAKPIVSRRKKIINIRAERNKIENKKKLRKSMKLKVGSLERLTKLTNR